MVLLKTLSTSIKNFPVFIVLQLFRTYLKFMFTIAILPTYLSLLFLFVVYRKFIDILLSIQVGPRYGGLLCDGDPLFAVQKDITKSMINILVMVESTDSNFFENVKHTCRVRVFDPFDRLIKIAAVWRCAYGYSYIVKDKYSIEECVREIPDEIRDERDLQRIFTKYGNQPLPKNHTVFWEMLVGKNPIKWNNTSNCYPIIIRCNHTMSDGINVLDTFAKLSDNVFFTRLVNPIYCNSVAINWIKHLYSLIRLPAFILFEIILKERDSNSLMDKTLSRKATLTWRIDDGNTITKIKDIKRKMPGSTFTDVLITAISASFEDYFAQNGQGVPENFTIGYPIHCDILNGSEFGLTNNFSLVFSSTPIQLKSKSLVAKLREVSRRQKIRNNCNNILAYYWLTAVLPPYLPSPILELFSNLESSTLGISKIPSGPYWKLFGGQLVDLIPCTCHYNSSGMSLVLISYGGERMQFGFSVDEALIGSVEKVEDILYGISKYVNVLHQEVHKSKMNSNLCVENGL